MEKFNFNPPQIFTDSSKFPNPSNGLETRTQLMIPLEQIRDYINNVLSLQIKEIVSSNGSIQVTYGDENIDLKIIVSENGVTKEYVDTQVSLLKQEVETIDEMLIDILGV